MARAEMTGGSRGALFALFACCAVACTGGDASGHADPVGDGGGYSGGAAGAQAGSSGALGGGGIRAVGGSSGAASGGIGTAGSSGRGGATSTGGASSGGAGTGGVGGATLHCQPSLNAADLDTGFESCDDGSMRRRAAIQCPAADVVGAGACNPAYGPYCASDAECTSQPLGYCTNAHLHGGYCGCFYGCQKDSDCGQGSICECGVLLGQCVPATCATSADCSGGAACVRTLGATPSEACTFPSPSPRVSYACLAAADLCHGNLDCPSSNGNQGACFMNGGHRSCGTLCALTP